MSSADECDGFKTLHGAIMSSADECDGFKTLHGAILSSADECDGFKTLERSMCLPFCGSTYEPECDDGSLQPALGMVFDSLEQGEVFYKAYAHHIGFSVRKSTQHKGKDGEHLWKKFVCSKEGWRKKRMKPDAEDNQTRRNVKLTRCGCEAMIGFKRREDGSYEVARFVQSHTHRMVSPNQTHLIRSNREVTCDIRNTLFTCKKAMVGTSSAFRLLCSQKGGPSNVGCTKRDIENYDRDCKLAFKHADGQVFIELMKNKQRVNPAFFFDYELDDKKRLKHVFWADGVCRKNYSLFGEVVSFDATYRSNLYDLVFAPFTGVNHHKSSVTFGAAFVSNEKIESYRWLFQTFLKAMGGVAPKLIITDEDISMKAAIRDELPNTIHRLCMWHILNKLPERIGSLTKDDDFLHRFNACVWGSETPSEFESRWSSIIADFGLQNNSWLDMKYEMRGSWIPAYFVDYSLGAILRTTSRSESENAFFRHFLNRRLSLLEFWIRFETAIEEQREKELLNDNATLHSLPELETPWSTERHGRDVYTHTVFALFQDEVVAARDRCDVQSMVQVGDVRTTCIRDGFGKTREVQYNTITKVAQCSCKLFEAIGILCSHIILVLKGEQCNEIPSHYVLPRWTKMATRRHVFDANGHLLEGSCATLPPILNTLYSETCSKLNLGLHAARQCEEKMRYLHRAVAEAVSHVLQMDPSSDGSTVQEFELFFGTTLPKEIYIQPPEIAHTKGKGWRFRRGSEQFATSKKRKRLKGAKNIAASNVSS